MNVFRRVPLLVWGVVGTCIVVGLLLMYGESKDDPREQRPAPSSQPTITARQDPQGLKQTKDELDQALRTFVKATMSRSPGLRVDDYLDRIETLATPEMLRAFEVRLHTPIERAYIEQSYKIRPRIIGSSYGHLDVDGETVSSDGTVRIRLEMIALNGERIVTQPLDYDILMVKLPGDPWRGEYLAPTTT